jgi:hypothetical protein
MAGNVMTRLTTDMPILIRPALAGKRLSRIELE